MSNYMTISLYQYFQLICLVISFFCRKGLRRFSIIAFIPLLTIDNTIEFIGKNRLFFGWDNNYFIYNIYFIVSPPIYMYLYSKMLNLKKEVRNVFWAIFILCMLLILLNYFFIQGYRQFNTYSLMLFMILNIVLCCLVLFKLSLQQPQEEINLIFEPYFWINAANLLFSLVTLVVLGLQDYIISNHIEINKESLYHEIMPIANIVLYAGYSYAFLLCQKQKHRLS